MREAPIVLGMVLVLCAASFAGVADSESFLEAGSDVAVSAAVALTEAHLGNLLVMMGILASTADLKVGMWGGMQDLLSRFELLPISFNAWFLLPDGSYYKVETGLTGSNLAERTYFPKVMAGETTVGDLVVSKSTGRKSMVMTVPIERNSEVIGALGATVYLDDFSQQIADALALPEGVLFYAYDLDGVIALHSDVERLMEDASEAGVDPSTSVSAVSSSFGWTFVVGAMSN